MSSVKCRALKHGVEDAKKLINSEAPTVVAFSEDQSAEIRDRIFDEFNTLAVVYHQPSYAFVQQASHDDLQENVVPTSSSCKLFMPQDLDFFARTDVRSKGRR